MYRVSVRGKTIDPPVPAAVVEIRAPAKRSWLILLLAEVAIGVLLQCFGPVALRQAFTDVSLRTPEDLFEVLLALLVSVIIHESGHLAAALACGFSVLGGALGPFRLTRTGGGWHVQFDGSRWFAASVSAVPQRKGNWRKHMLFVIGSGPAATLLLGVGALYLYSLHNTSLLAFFVQINALLFLLGLVPNGPGAAVRNDANLFLALSENTPDAHCILLYHLLLQIQLQGFRPCFYPEQIVRALATAQPQPEMALLFARAISDWAFDRKDLATADAWDARSAEMGALCSIALHSTALAHAAQMDLLVRNDYVSARSRCAVAEIETIQPAWLEQQARGIRAVLALRIGEALEAWQRAEFALPPDVPFADYQRDILKRLRLIAKTLAEGPLQHNKVLVSSHGRHDFQHFKKPAPF